MDVKIDATTGAVLIAKPDKPDAQGKNGKDAEEDND